MRNRSILALLLSLCSIVSWAQQTTWIANVKIQPTSSTAAVTWTTPIASTSQVSWGTVSGTFTQTVSSTTKVLSHSMTLSGLKASTTYYIKIVSRDAANTAVSATSSFKTSAATTLPTVGAAPGSLSFAFTVGGSTPAASKVAVSSSGAAVTFTASTSATWLTVSGSGTTPGTASVAVKPAGLAVGSYSGTVVISSTGAANPSLNVPVTLTVSSSTPPSGGSGGLLYLSAKAGPNHGWTNSATRGAAITLWGRNFGSTRGTGYVSVGGVKLTSDSDYAEWGATSNPKTPKDLQRITFWLNSIMPVGATTVSVTVNGVTTNALPFTIDNTGVIRFVSQANGSDSYDGQYPDHSLGGSHGPWKTPFMYDVRPGTGPGMFLYLRGENYTAIFDPSSGHPDMAFIGYFEEGGTNCTVYYPTIDGTDALRYTVTSYPGEVAVFGNVSIYNNSSYWTVSNVRFNGSYDGYTMGNEWSHCSDCQRHSKGLDLIGTEWIGPNHHVVNAFGDNFRILANYLNTSPVASGGYDATTSYPLYLSAGATRLVKDNEIHGGGMYSIHNYDEPRCSATDVNRYMTDHLIDSNLLDITRAGTNPVDMRAGIITGEDVPGNAVSNITIQNNVVYSRDSLASESCFKLFSETATTLDGIHYYDNTCYNAPAGLSVIYSTVSHYKNVDLKNNIFSKMGSYEINVDGGSSVDINPLFQFNFVEQTPRFNGNATASSNVVAPDPMFIAPSSANFRLQSGSPAIGKGTAITTVLSDDDGKARSNPPTIGAFESK